MKKILTVLTIVLSVSAFSQDDSYGKINKNRLLSGVETGYVINSGGISEGSVISTTIPSFKYELQFRPQKIIQLYLDGSFGIDKTKELFEGEAEGDANVYASDTYLRIDPAMKLFIGGSFFYRNSLKYAFNSFNEQLKNAESHSSTSLSMISSFGYDSREIDKYLISPWGLFEKGFLADFYYSVEFFRTFDNEDEEETSRKSGLEIAYAFLDMQKNIMYRPYVKYDAELNTKLVYPWWLTAGVFAAWDILPDLNLTADLSTRYGQIDPDKKLGILMGTETFVSGSAGVSYYVFGNLSLELKLSAEQMLNPEEGVQPDQPEITISAGARYISDFR
jgi:hypothetical protein